MSEKEKDHFMDEKLTDLSKIAALVGYKAAILDDVKMLDDAPFGKIYKKHLVKELIKLRDSAKKRESWNLQ